MNQKLIKKIKKGVRENPVVGVYKYPNVRYNSKTIWRFSHSPEKHTNIKKAYMSEVLNHECSVAAL